MAKKRRTVGPDDIIAINEAYLRIGTYAGAGRETGWSGSTVKRYIIPDYTPVLEEKQEKREFVIPKIEDLDFSAGWSAIMTLTESELNGCKELQKFIKL